jgi:pimeloyl-ACP methyl ester carboxylesterase
MQNFTLKSNPIRRRASSTIAAAACAACLLALAVKVHAAGHYLKVDYPASTNANELQTAVTYTLWLPDGVKTIRGLIVHQHGAGTTASIEGSTAAYDLHWQALAQKWDCALLGPSYHVLNEKIDLSPGGSELWFDPRKGSEKTFLRALTEFAAKSGHPELENVPWVLWGHSGGGIWANVMAALHPERVVAMWLRSGSAAMFRVKPEFPPLEIPAAVYGIPAMCNPGVKEKKNLPWSGTLATFQEYRAKGAPIGFAPDPRTGHECGDSRYLAIPFLDACMAMRLPDKGGADQTLKPVDMSQGWLAPLLGDQAQPAASFQGDPNQAVWLPNQPVAKAWMEYVKTGAVGDTTPPPAPYDVSVTSKGDEGTEIRWSADADFESGIRCFVILRDGQELASVPRKPFGKYGRPLFQSMTYHDTPSQPLPEMRYLDATAKAGEAHSYAVITVNSVELKSEPAYAQAGGYQFDGTMSRQVLENYLARSITMEGLLNGRGDLEDNIRMLKGAGAKYIGRALCLWGAEADFLHNIARAREEIPRVLAADPEMILEACVFETVSPRVNQIAIPDWVFAALGQPVENRNFRYDDMIYPEGQRRPMGRNAQVPDESRLETRLWFYYQAASYIDAGCEAIHFGQVEIMNKNDRDNGHWAELLALVRAYAAQHARRHMVLCNGHVPSGGLMRDGRPLLDFHAFPLRVMEEPDKPQEAILKVGFSDGIYGRSKGGVTFSGWTCEHLPYLVELDNWGASKQPGQAKAGGIWVWGYDEITWFAHQSPSYRGDWLRYASDWVRKTDTNGFLEMPGSRTESSPLDHKRWYYANTPSPAVPDGLGDEQAIGAIWASDSARP